MNIKLVKLSKEKLISGSQSERSFFLIMAHLANEINMLSRFLFWSSEFQSNNDAEDNGRVAMIFMFLRLLAGKLFEGNNLLVKNFYGSKLSIQYQPTLSEEGQDLLKKLKKYFNGKSTVKYIRNNYASHYSPDDLDSVLESVPEELELYVSDKNVNTLFYFAEVLANRAILKNIDASNDFESYKKLIKELTMVARWFSKLAELLIIKFLSIQGDDILDGFVEDLHFENLPSINDIQIPWFVNIDEIIEHET